MNRADVHALVILVAGIALGTFLAEWLIAKTKVRYQALQAQGS